MGLAKTVLDRALKAARDDIHVGNFGVVAKGQFSNDEKIMLTLFATKVSLLTSHNTESESLRALDTKVAEFKDYDEKLGLDVRANYQAVCLAHEQESHAIMHCLREAERAKDAKAAERSEKALRQWFESKLSSMVNDYSPAAKEFQICSAFALVSSEKYRKLKYLLAGQNDFSMQALDTQQAIDRLRESMKKFDLAKSHVLFHYAYQHETENQYSPPAVRMNNAG